MTDPSFIYDERDRRDEELEQREPPLDWAAYDPTLTEEQAEELAEAVNRYVPCQRDMDEVNYRLAEEEDTPRPRLTEAQERARGELARRLADGENVPMSLFM